MEKFSLDTIAREQAKRAAVAPSGRSAETGEATVQVLRGRVRLIAGEVAWEGRAGDLLVVPDARHGLQAVQDAVILLTVSKAAQARLEGRPDPGGAGPGG